MTIILIIIFLLCIFGLIFLYNQMVKAKNTTEEAYAQIDVELKRRTDLIDNLVETVKGYAGHERETLIKVIEARGQVANAATPKQQQQAEGILQQALKSLFAVVENYPNLKADQHFITLQRTLEDIENRLASTRSRYNDVVRQYNTLIQSFPANTVAGIYGFKEKEYYEVTEAERTQLEEPPKVKF